MKSDGMVIVSKFRFGDKVRMEGGDIVGIVTTISTTWRESEPLSQYEVAWFHAGVRYSAWMHEWQLMWEGSML